MTVEKYVESVGYFVKFIGFKSPENAPEAMLKGEVDAGEKIDAFIDYALEEIGRSHSSVRSMIFGIKKWFDLNGVTANWVKIEMPASNMTREQDRAPTKDDLKKLLNHANSSRDRAVIFIGS